MKILFQGDSHSYLNHLHKLQEVHTIIEKPPNEVSSVALYAQFNSKDGAKLILKNLPTELKKSYNLLSVTLPKIYRSKVIYFNYQQ